MSKHFEDKLNEFRKAIISIQDSINNLTTKTENLERRKYEIDSSLIKVELMIQQFIAEAQHDVGKKIKVEQMQKSLADTKMAYKRKIDSIVNKKNRQQKAKSSIPSEIDNSESELKDGEQKMAILQAQYQSALLEHREKEAQEILIQIRQIKEMTQDIAKMLNDQTEDLRHADELSYKASQNTEAAASELKEADRLDAFAFNIFLKFLENIHCE
ncbi:uncharacterized protein MONOS_3703 [Monocercomonoides exilis]|uniref:uncharacterized protein n=1 Tax=Monocercomonoides exilis TaxID=2049356 RepID=UPI003559D7C5|nr:hypothetical protein MONOS_3703 [Monocercomonoides exilis]